MDPNPLLRLRSAIRLRKQQLVDARGVGADLATTLVTMAGGRLLASHELPPGGVTTLTTALAAVAFSDCDRAVIVSEHYVSPEPTAPDTDFGARFAAGDPAVMEAYAAVVVGRTGDVTMWFDPYCYVGTQVQWLDVPHPSPELAEALIRRAAAVILEGFRSQETRPHTARTLGYGQQLVQVGAPQPVGDRELLVCYALVGTCPCGKGRPMNECCATQN